MGSGTSAAIVREGGAITPALAALIQQLAKDPLPDATRERLQRYLQSGGDSELERALEATGQNPLQAAFTLTMRAAGPQLMDDDDDDTGG